MSEEEIRKHLGRQSGSPREMTPRMRVVPRRATETEPAGYEDFSATHLFCPRCRQAMPVRERVMLYLADGDLYDYSCTACGTSVGTRKAGK
jgi:hypothetical protein